MKLHSIGSFDSFNQYIAKGSSAGISLVVETLMTSPADEISAEYGLIAETIEVPDDLSYVIYNLRPQARFHDGKPITADDVIFSFEVLREKGRPFYRYYYRNISKVEKLGTHRVKFHFTGPPNRELPQITGQLPVLPKHYWQTRDFSQTTLEPPLGSGPYRIARFEAGRFVQFERVRDYWGADLPINRGLYNFDRLRIDYYRDQTIALEAFKANEYDYRMENSSKDWATGYRSPAVEAGLVRTEEVTHARPTGMQSFAFQPSAREVQGSPRAPGNRLCLRLRLVQQEPVLWPVRAHQELFFQFPSLPRGRCPMPPRSPCSSRCGAGSPIRSSPKSTSRPTATGRATSGETSARRFACSRPPGGRSRTIAWSMPSRARSWTSNSCWSPRPFRGSLPHSFATSSVWGSRAPSGSSIPRNTSIGCAPSTSTWWWRTGASPNRPATSSATSGAAMPPSARAAENYAGIENPVIDGLIEKLIAAQDRKSLVIATRALDRVLLWNHYVVPNWHARFDRIAYWDKFGKSAKSPKYGTDFYSWWIDPDKDRTLKSRKAKLRRAQ